uniref:Uncharacterized protein n=1 Tax=Phytophthora infestans TaxID=4787 RepID=Q572K0_PHYIN|nr:hypothetical protein PI35.0250c [Phytophthora infestans]
MSLHASYRLPSIRSSRSNSPKYVPIHAAGLDRPRSSSNVLTCCCKTAASTRSSRSSTLWRSRERFRPGMASFALRQRISFLSESIIEHSLPRVLSGPGDTTEHDVVSSPLESVR